MNSKDIKKHLSDKVNDWAASVDDITVANAIKDGTIITGGALVSLLTGEEVNDYDVYFRNKEALVTVAQYYVDKWNKEHDDEVFLEVDEENATSGSVRIIVPSSGVAESKEDNEDDSKYTPIFLSSNAITLSNKVQIVIRFYGEVEDIHKNYDFVHCTCSWTSWDNEVQLPAKALECIINKELVYTGSRYPLCSIIRTRKYIERGYSINAGQYVKMALQLNELDLNNIDTLKDQITGVNSYYFKALLEDMHIAAKSGEKVDNSFIFEAIDKVFN